ncbi:hypothetical protein CTAYLR_003683 [Chrysophaeum taylorii]|uniref:Exostosin GT47 domain-containing protein n=1 Tax=Chrysophaeum taylorii TaxID=2483200 RepID=A0AAD7XNF4_9STRA|nr:hypothetical protein CTAYLR_003683 [Chrysophaeum taylorii]
MVAGGESKPRMWPRVYVYDLPVFWDEERFTLRDMRPSVEKKRLRVQHDVEKRIFGHRCEGFDESKTSMFTVVEILLWRVLRSPLYYEPDPSLADLFFVPIWPRDKNEPGWLDVCSRDVNFHVEHHLKHFTEANAHRHFFVVAKGHTKPKLNCDAWWKKPRGLLQRAMRFAYSEDFSELSNKGGYGPLRFDDDYIANELAPDALEDGDVFFPHLVSIPYPSSVHAEKFDNAHFHRVHYHKRRIFTSFIGSDHTLGNASGKYAMARAKLMRDCLKRRETCSCFRTDHHMLQCGQLVEEYANATFCFQPGGDSPYRKGLYDALALGCIPVVFGLYETRVSPWHFWTGHRQNSMVVINETAYLRGEIDVFDHLLSISDTSIRKMQAIIAQNAHRLQYAYYDFPDDAVDIILRGAWHMAKLRDAIYHAQATRAGKPRPRHYS